MDCGIVGSSENVGISRGVGRFRGVGRSRTSVDRKASVGPEASVNLKLGIGLLLVPTLFIDKSRSPDTGVQCRPIVVKGLLLYRLIMPKLLM